MKYITLAIMPLMELRIIAVTLLLTCGYFCNTFGLSESIMNRVGSNVSDEKLNPTINVYIENSGSMDGYVNGNTDFKHTIYSYLSDIYLHTKHDTMGLHYINATIPYSKYVKSINDVENYSKNLTVASFKAAGGNRATSDIAKVLQTILKRASENNVSILITDGVFSPDKGNASDYLRTQQRDFTNCMTAFLQTNENIGVIVYQLLSRFDGKYYNCTNKPIKFVGERPYYIWLIGNVQNLRLLHQIPPADIRHTFMISSDNTKVNYAIKRASGNFHLDKTDPRHAIVGWKLSNKGIGTPKAQLSINVDFSNLLLDEEYILDLSNYAISDSHIQLSVSNTQPNTQGYTHTLRLLSDKVRKGMIAIRLKTRFPAWAEEVNDDEGTKIIEGKTFGIKYQLEGIFDAFTYQQNYYSELIINSK